jgi:hypothetical protein
MAVGMDIGTGFLVSARPDNGGQIKTKSIRDAFLDINTEDDPSIKNMLKMSKVNYIEDGDKLYIIGDAAITMSNIFNRAIRRPLSNGVICPGESEAERVLLSLLGSILGESNGGVCYYSVPGNPVDKSLDIVYHQAIFGRLLSSLGYSPCVAMNEAAAIIYSNAAPEMFSGIGISFGAGMCNVSLLYQTMIGMSFSIIGSGNFIDESVARATGSTPGKIQAIKEKGINLLDPNEGVDTKHIREREALIIYYKSLILKVLTNIKTEFKKNKGNIELPSAIPIILSGGTSLPRGFKELFEEGFKTIKDFEIPISEIRMAQSPLEAVAQGLLIAAMNHEDSLKSGNK